MARIAVFAHERERQVVTDNLGAFFAETRHLDHEVWLEWDIPGGANWHNEIVQALKADFVIVAMSARMAASSRYWQYIVPALQKRDPAKTILVNFSPFVYRTIGGHHLFPDESIGGKADKWVQVHKRASAMLEGDNVESLEPAVDEVEHFACERFADPADALEPTPEDEIKETCDRAETALVAAASRGGTEALVMRLSSFGHLSTRAQGFGAERLQQVLAAGTPLRECLEDEALAVYDELTRRGRTMRVRFKHSDDQSRPMLYARLVLYI